MPTLKSQLYQLCLNFIQNRIENIEYSLFILALQILLTALIVYIYLESLKSLLILLFIITGTFDIVILTFYIYFVIKFKKEEIFTSLPKTCFSVSDVLNIINLIMKTINFLLLFVLSKEIVFMFALSFILKFVIDIYFCFVTIKIYMFCPCGMWCSEYLNRMWNGVKYYLFCCEVEDNNSIDMEYSKMEDMESFY